MVADESGALDVVDVRENCEMHPVVIPRDEQPCGPLTNSARGTSDQISSFCLLHNGSSSLGSPTEFLKEPSLD